MKTRRLENTKKGYPAAGYGVSWLSKKPNNRACGNPEGPKTYLMPAGVYPELSRRAGMTGESFFSCWQYSYS
jgi:hypothetical protein